MALSLRRLLSLFSGGFGVGVLGAILVTFWRRYAFAFELMQQPNISTIKLIEGGAPLQPTLNKIRTGQVGIII